MQSGDTLISHNVSSQQYSNSIVMPLAVGDGRNWTYGWWFRNPKANHLGCMKPLKKKRDIYHINWCRISSINRMFGIWHAFCWEKVWGPRSKIQRFCEHEIQIQHRCVCVRVIENVFVEKDVTWAKASGKEGTLNWDPKLGTSQLAMKVEKKTPGLQWTRAKGMSSSLSSSSIWTTQI